MEEPKIELPALIELLDTDYDLYYVDYRDNLNDSLEMVQEAIHGNTEKLDEMFMDWDTYETVEIILNEQLQGAVQNKFDLDEDEAKELIEQHKDELRYAIEDRDSSDPLKDLIKNTGKQVFFYDTGIELEGYGGDMKNNLRVTKKALKILQKNKEFDASLKEMFENASYGGQLVIYFYDTLGDWLNMDEKINTIFFSGLVRVAVIDTGGGSGFDTVIKHSFSLPFLKENLFLDKTIKYSYTYEVCGMSSNWCESTEVAITTTLKHYKQRPAKSSINDHLEREKQLNATYKGGGCTTGDMDINRHRDTFYENNFPCGTICPHCHTFWID